MVFIMNTALAPETQSNSASPLQPEPRRGLILRNQIAFGLVHLVPLAAFFTNVTGFDWVLCIALYVARMFFVTAGYHRYFSHRTFKTSRVFQFILAFLAQTSAQKGVLWWAAHHRAHHKHSDTPQDPHSMKIYGFWYSHLGWILGPDYDETDFSKIGDLAKFPELHWLNRYYLVPPFVLALATMAAGGYYVTGELSVTAALTHGWSTLFIGFFLSTVLLYHGTFSINSIMHKFGKPRYDTGDESKNNLVLALITLGEGWHNNHHYYQSTARQGFFWWEIDISYYLIRALAFLGIVWDVREVPEHIKFPKGA
jgi:stearoyl-CoA desaturase (delta-9 desaturase)